MMDDVDDASLIYKVGSNPKSSPRVRKEARVDITWQGGEEALKTLAEVDIKIGTRRGKVSAMSPTPGSGYGQTRKIK